MRTPAFGVRKIAMQELVFDQLARVLKSRGSRLVGLLVVYSCNLSSSASRKLISCLT